MLITAGISAGVEKYCGRNVMQQTGTQPLHMTTFGPHGGFADVARVLLEAGADVNAAERNGRTTLHHVAIRNAYRVLDVLLEYKCHLDPVRWEFRRLRVSFVPCFAYKSLPLCQS
jgi:ankyrin repeat protein